MREMSEDPRLQDDERQSLPKKAKASKPFLIECRWTPEAYEKLDGFLLRLYPTNEWRRQRAFATREDAEKSLEAIRDKAARSDFIRNRHEYRIVERGGVS